MSNQKTLKQISDDSVVELNAEEIALLERKAIEITEMRLTTAEREEISNSDDVTHADLIKHVEENRQYISW